MKKPSSDYFLLNLTKVKNKHEIKAECRQTSQLRNTMCIPLRATQLFFKASLIVKQIKEWALGFIDTGNLNGTCYFDVKRWESCLCCLAYKVPVESKVPIWSAGTYSLEFTLGLQIFLNFVTQLFFDLDKRGFEMKEEIIFSHSLTDNHPFPRNLFIARWNFLCTVWQAFWYLDARRTWNGTILLWRRGYRFLCMGHYCYSVV